MARYFFHLHNDLVALDEEGRECADDAQARESALNEAREMIAESVTLQGQVVLSHHIDVHDENGFRFRVAFGEALEIVR